MRTHEPLTEPHEFVPADEHEFCRACGDPDYGSWHILGVTCPYCKAGVGQRCFPPNPTRWSLDKEDGRQRVHPHKARRDKATNEGRH